VREVDLDRRPRLEAQGSGALVRADREQSVDGEEVAAARLSPADPVQLAQLLERVDADIGVRADAEPDPAVEDALDRQEAVAEVRLRRRAGADSTVRLAEEVELASVRIGRVDDGRARAEAAAVREELDRAHAVLGHALLDLAWLLVGVNVERQLVLRRVAAELDEPLTWTGANRVRGHADTDPGSPQLLEPPQVLRDGRLAKAVEPTAGIGGVEEHELDPCVRRCSGGGVRLGEAEVMELAHRGVAGFTHLGVHRRVLLAHALGRLAASKLEHGLAPGPEVGALSTTAQRPLESMAVDVDEPAELETVLHRREDTSVLRRLLVVGLAGAWLAVPAAHAGTVSIFYYPWYGTAAHDGSWEHWNQNGHAPPDNIYSRFYPARGVYSSASRSIVGAQMAEIASAGVDEVIVSWWGRGSVEDRRLPLVLSAAQNHGLRVAIHLEPYRGRSAESVSGDLAYMADLGIRDVFVYRPRDIAATDWASILPEASSSLQVFAGDEDVSFAVQGRFSGFYTYDFVNYGGASFIRLCGEAHRAGLLCAPSVGPGYDGARAGEPPVLKPRRNGATYDALWIAAIRAHPDYVTITSYNEWGEGTQIEPAAPRPGYRSYSGSWGLRGVAASTSYLARTAYWAERFHAGG
jgi:glycoprotein endo-alpha-1,2-mannosidase